jgi:hypothetical protein
MWILIFSLVACKETIEPNGIWTVTITGLETDCIESEEGYQETYEYSLFYDGSYVDIKVDGESFASGQIRGCSIQYESGIYLEESDSGDFRWKISGTGDVEAEAGGCGDIPDEYDWYGTETLTVVSSENEDVAEDCEYVMETTGVYSF